MNFNYLNWYANNEWDDIYKKISKRDTKEYPSGISSEINAEGNLELSFELAGMKKEEISVEINENFIVHVHAENEKRKKNYRYVIPKEYSRNPLKSTYTDGLLFLVLPRLEEKTKVIKITL
jgi:HSP20 family molecular chaperone IbpA